MDNAVLAYLRSKGMLPPDAAQAAPPAVAAPMTAGVDDTLERPSLIQPPPPAAAAAPPPPAPPAVPTSMPDLSGKDAAAVALAGLGDAYSAAGGRTTTGAKDVLENIQAGPARAAERASTIRNAQDVADKDDPNSATSRLYQQLAAKYTGKTPEELGHVSATKLGQIFPTIEKFAAVEETAKTRKEIADENNATRNMIMKNGMDWKEAMFGEKKKKDDDKQWVDFQKTNDPMTGGSRTVIGMLGRANLQGKRALNTLLNNPTVTNADLGNVIADIAGIYAGGAPTDMGMKHQSYDTLFGKVKGMTQYLTGNPTDSVPDAVKNKIVSTLRDMMKTNTEILRNHNTSVEKRNKWLLEKHPDEWKEFRQGIEVDPSQTGPQTFEPDVVAYAQKHSISNEQAQQIKNQRTSGGVGR